MKKYTKPNFLLNPLLMAIVVIVMSLSSCSRKNVEWTIELEQPEKSAIVVGQFNDSDEMPIQFKKTIDGIDVDVTIQSQENLIVFNAKANSQEERQCFISLKAIYQEGIPYSYNGEEQKSKIFRQSPHDPKNHVFPQLVKQVIPMVALKMEDETIVAISNTPAFYDNYTTQTIDVTKNQIGVSSGDNGNAGGSDPTKVIIESCYHPIGKEKTHTFDGIIFKSKANDLNNLRKDVLMSIAKRWGENITSRFGATSFGSNYMLIRKNETGNSNYWVVPAIEYANKQYSRDAFWQSMVLPAEFSQECYLNEAVAQSTGAERPLFCLIWAYRTKLEGGEPDMVAAQKTLNYIQNQTKNGWYYSSDDKKRQDFQSWYDLVAFEEDDVISYNQGLLCVALMAAEALGLEPTISSSLAIKNYQSMYNPQNGYFSLSQQKDLLAVDPLVGDLLSQLYFNKPLLSDESVISHFKRVVEKAKTPFGYKVTCLPDGSYAPVEAYGTKLHKITWDNPGHYQWGGSWYVYDMLFLIDSYLHQAPGSLDEIKWRGALDFKLGGTYFEHTHTKTGKPNKPNQGWDAAIYAIWHKLIEQGKADYTFFEVIDKI